MVYTQDGQLAVYECQQITALAYESLQSDSNSTQLFRLVKMWATYKECQKNLSMNEPHNGKWVLIYENVR